MANTKKLIGAAAFSLALAGGGVAGALLGAPGSSGAQESTTTTTAVDTPPPDGPGFHRGPGPRLTAAAEAIGISEDDLRAALESGKTIAQVAEEHGVAVDTVIDAIVAEATADIRERVTDMVNNGLPERGERRERFQANVEAVTTALGMTPEELRTALESGTSIADVAADKGVDVQTVIDALVAAGVPADRAEEIVNHAGPFHHHDGPRP
jgi:nucleotide-binding universal stress UspA family protein